MIRGRQLQSIVALTGLAISAYLTVVHYASGAVPLACPRGSLVNCDLVTSSPQSMIGPVPVALLGLIWFAVYLALARLPASLESPASQAKLGWTIIGLVFVFYFVYAELFLIGAICLWCTGAHVATVLLFLFALSDYLDRTAELVTE